VPQIFRPAKKMGCIIMQAARKSSAQRWASSLLSGALVAAGLMAAGSSGPAAAATASAPGCVSSGLGLSCDAANGTPHFPLGTASTYQIRQLVQCGSEMFAVGHFDAIIGFNGVTKQTQTYQRSNAFSFLARPPFSISRWNPDVSGTVNSIALGGKNCSVAYLGGTFGSVHGTTVSNIAQVSATTGVVNTAFAHNANHSVETLLLTGGRLLTGGLFTAINGSGNRYYIALNPATGHGDGYLRLNISGNYSFPGVSVNRTRVYNQQLSHGGHRVLAEGDFTSAGGKPRRQIFMIWLGPGRASVTNWTSPEFNGNCYRTEPFYVKAAAWGPTDNSVYVATTGFHPNGVAVAPVSLRTGLCDAAAKFSAVETTHAHTWINYTGCDSLYAAVAGSSTIYVGGHERWADNGDGCDNAGPGAVAAPGMVGLSQASGQVSFNPTRGRGLGADDMILTSAGLWVASDNFSDAQDCAGAPDHSGICFLPRG
jgi:hypothetical protein